MARSKPTFIFGIGEKAWDEDNAQIGEAERQLEEYKKQSEQKIWQQGVAVDTQAISGRRDLYNSLNNAKAQNQVGEARAKLASVNSGGGSDIYNAAIKASAGEQVRQAETEGSKDLNRAYTMGQLGVRAMRAQADSEIKTQSFAIDQATRQLPSQLDAILGGVTPLIKIAGGAALAMTGVGTSKGIELMSGGLGDVIGGSAGGLIKTAGDIAKNLDFEAVGKGIEKLFAKKESPMGTADPNMKQGLSDLDKKTKRDNQWQKYQNDNNTMESDLFDTGGSMFNPMSRVNKKLKYSYRNPYKVGTGL